MEPPLKRLDVDKSSNEIEDCCEEIENQQTLENTLAYDELRIVFQYLSAKDLYKASGVCRSWRIAAQEEAATRHAPEYFLKNYQIHNEEKTKNDYDPVLIGEDLRIKPYVGLICQKIQEKDEWVPKGCYCKNLPYNCTTVIVGGYDIVADDTKIDKEFGMAVSAFIPQIPKLERKVYGRLNCGTGLVTNITDIELPLLPSESEQSKCIIMLTSQTGYNIANNLMGQLQKSYKPGTISLWGGVCVDLKTCTALLLPDTRNITICSESIHWMVITLSSPVLQTWSIVLPRNCKTEAQMEEKLKNLQKKIEFKKHSLGLMFACCERIHRKNAEIAVFKKVFPNIPLIGLHGDGEYGLNTLNESTLRKKTRKPTAPRILNDIFNINISVSLGSTAIEFDVALSYIIE